MVADIALNPATARYVHKSVLVEQEHVLSIPRAEPPADSYTAKRQKAGKPFAYLIEQAENLLALVADSDLRQGWIAAVLSDKVTITITTASAVAAHIYPSSEKILAATKFIAAKGATPNLTTQVAELLLQDVMQLHETLAPVSAFSAIMISPAASVVPPATNRAASAVTISGIGGAWVGEGGRIPMMRGTLANTPVPIGKVAGMIALTNDTLAQSPSALAASLTRALQRGIAKMLDVAILSADPAIPAIRPADLLNTVTPVAAGTTPQEGVSAVLAAISGG